MTPVTVQIWFRSEQPKTNNIDVQLKKRSRQNCYNQSKINEEVAVGFFVRLFNNPLMG